MFQDDDEEIWKLLASSAYSEDDEDELGQRLKSLASRFVEDHKQTTNGEYFGTLVSKLQSLGFRYSSGEPHSFPYVPPTGGDDSQPPVAFESEQGVKHLEATSALLNISRERAIQVTLSALRSIDSDKSQFQPLLGTRDLLLKTFVHHCNQRLARLGVLTECLRLEQDPNAHARESIMAFLDSQDSLFLDGDYSRGLFRCLICIACAPLHSFNREHLQPAKSLHASKNMTASLQNDSSSSSSSSTWNSFYATLLDQLRTQQLRERAEAMEALLVLCYDRIQGGIHRSDYALLLVAFKDAFHFFTHPPYSTLQQQDLQQLVSRLPKLAGLICAESTALWRALDPTAISNDWALRHPLLIEVSNNSNAATSAQLEIQSLCRLVQEYSESIQGRTDTSMALPDQSPEALALLSFGLLLRLAHDSLKSCVSPNVNNQEDLTTWSFFEAIGIEMAKSANDQYAAFDYLLAVLESLTTANTPKQVDVNGDVRLYDWQLSQQRSNLLLLMDESSSQEAAPETTAYTTIAREILAASIAAFAGNGILAIDQSNSCDNLRMLCNLGSAIFQNNSLLCQQFWTDWENYLESRDDNSFFLCKLLDATHRLATTALQAFEQAQIPAPFLVQASAPFFQFLASVTHNPNIVESTLSMLPEGMVCHVLMSCHLPQYEASADDSYAESCYVLVGAFARLAQVGNSKSCLECLRRSLNNASVNGGPRILARLVDKSSTRGTHNRIVEPAMTIMAQLLKGAPAQWALQLAGEPINVPGARLSLALFLAQEEYQGHAAASLLLALTGQLAEVVFCDAINHEDTVTYLRSITTSVLAGCNALAISLSATNNVYYLDFKTVQTILHSISTFLTEIRTVIKLPRAALIRETGLEMRDAVINALASSTGLGKAVMYYATSPVALTLAINIQGALEDQSIWQQISDFSEEDRTKQFGAWHSVLQPHEGDVTQRLAKHFLVDSIDTLDSNDIDLDGIAMRNWTGIQSPDAPLDTARAAIQLLALWASHVEDILSTHVEDIQAEPLPLQGPPNELIKTKSPLCLLSSLATVPVPCRMNADIKAIWDAAALSNFELLLPYLAGVPDFSDTTGAVPSTIALDLIHACLGHVQYVFPKEAMADSSLFAAVFRSSRFCEVLVQSIDNALQVKSKPDPLNSVEKSVVLDGLLSLRILATCVDANPMVADSMLHPNDDSIVPKLIEAATITTTLSLGDPAVTFFNSESDITTLRLATSCLGVLSPLWRVVQSLPSTLPNPGGSRLVSTIEGQQAFVTGLVETVAAFVSVPDLDSRMGDSIMADYARGTLINYVSLALDLLATEVARDAARETIQNHSLKSFLMKDKIPLGRLFRYAGYELIAETTSQLSQTSLIRAGQPLNLLRCFPATARSSHAPDPYIIDNMFDVSSAVDWLYNLQGTSGDSESAIEDGLTKLSISYQLLNSELRVMQAFELFSSMSLFFIEDMRNGEVSPARIFEHAQTTAQMLNDNVKTVNSVQVEFDNFLLSESRKMVHCQTKLLLHTLDMATVAQGPAPSLDNLFGLLSLLADITEDILSVTLPVDANSFELTSEHPDLCIEKTLLACVLIVLSLFETNGTSLNAAQQEQLNDISKTLCFELCKILTIVCSWSSEAQSEPQGGHDTFLVAISLFTNLLSGKHGSSSDDSSYFKALRNVIAEYSVLEKILQQAIRSLSMVSKHAAVQTSPSTSHKVADHLRLLKAVLLFFNAIANTECTDLLCIIPGPSLAKVLVRNPLFITTSASSNTFPRGYIATSDAKNSPASPQSVFVGERDPLHDIWMTSIRVLANLLRTASHSSAARLFFDLSVEFLHVYRKEVITVLKSCGTRLTKTTLNEATAILSLAATLSQRNFRDHFLLSCQGFAEEIMSWSGFVAAALSKFLGAAGTARELFHSLQEIELAEVEFDSGDAKRFQPRHPVFAEGIPSAKHEAVKFAHYASRCYQRVTKQDFEASSTTSNRLTSLARNRGNYSDLERSSRLSVTNEFAAEMERVAASCLAQAISILWRLRPSASSFHVIAEGAVTPVNVMALVQPGMIIGFRPFDGSTLQIRGSGGGVFEGIQFGKVTNSDTVNRTWHVTPLQRGLARAATNDVPATVVVQAGQLVGLEDLSAKKAVSAYLPAPNMMQDLEDGKNVLALGHLVLILRWCHQETLFSDGAALDRGFEIDSKIRRLAEQTVALLGGEIAIHDEIGSRLNATPKDAQTLDAQIFELFSDNSIISASDNVENNGAVMLGQEGRLKEVIDPSAWLAVRPQIEEEVQRFWKDKLERERRRNEKRSLSSDTAWFSGIGRKGYSQKSAFRGLR